MLSRRPERLNSFNSFESEKLGILLYSYRLYEKAFLEEILAL